MHNEVFNREKLSTATSLEMVRQAHVVAVLAVVGVAVLAVVGVAVLAVVGALDRESPGAVEKVLVLEATNSD